MKVKKKIFLVDAYAIIYRAYFAFIKNPRINSKGYDTSTVFGFANSIFEIINKHKPTHLAVVFDSKEPTFRHIEFSEYKANRQEMPDPIKNSLDYIFKFLDSINVKTYAKPGYEADDIIGTISKALEKKEFEVFMMTPDKDFAQLVSKNIKMYRPSSKWKPSEIWGVENVLEQFKIQNQKQVIDLLALMGDASDNIPGIPGVGKITAQKFISQFGSVENLLENVDKISGKIKEKVIDGKESAILSKRLATIITDVPIEFDEKEMIVGQFNSVKLKELFDELEFRNLSEKIFSKKNRKATPTAESKQHDLFTNASEENKSEVIKMDDSEFKRELNSLKGVSHLSIALDNPSDEKSLCVFICDSNKKLLVNEINDGTKKFLKDFLESNFSSSTKTIISNNVKFLLKTIFQQPKKLETNFFDLHIAEYLIDSSANSQIRNLVAKYTNADFNDHFVLAFYETYKKQFDELKSSNLLDLFQEIEIPLIYALLEMEKSGIKIDIKFLNDLSRQLDDELFKLENEIVKISGKTFNVSSPKQLGEVLFDDLKLTDKPKKTKSGQYSTSEETLIRLRDKHPIINLILEHREINKLNNTYVKALPKVAVSERIHTTFNQTVTSTGRLSSVNPNIQNIPIRSSRGKLIRKAFKSRSSDFTLLAADYSQIELRIMASLSNDNFMISAFNNDLDIHSATASKINNVPLEKVTKEMRSDAKAVNFGIIYGISPHGLSQNLGISRNKAKEIIDSYFNEFKGVKKYMDFLIEEAKNYEFAKTIFNRKRPLRNINSKNYVLKSFEERIAINMPIQGTAADIIKIAMIDINNEIALQNLNSKMILQVHDELVFDVDKSEINEMKKLVKEKMENATKLAVPLKVDIGISNNWLDAH